ncbi:ABC transporter substrate-binding protein [uncultured Tyzzerella sp.]|uniref:ABC transporter substrate-binding protein n=1 Tax=uncultured Tyzzerella sp. TaxID=2321398 RepID=UPI002943D868|nr:ABC transporter substrate-binding protein [uncultured Tyzzerella sp.]
MKIYKLFFVIFVFIVLAGCKDNVITETTVTQFDNTIDNKTDDTINSIKETTPEATSEENNIQPKQEIPVEGGQLVLSMRMPKTLNPLVNEDVTIDNILKLIFEPLFSIDSDTLKPVPNIASSYSMSEDGKTVYIDIRNDIYWHDGKQLTAKDVIFSLDVIKSIPNSLYKSALDNVASYSNKGNQVIINYTEPYSFYRYNLCFPIIPIHYYKNNLDIENSRSLKPIGSGSFKYSSYRLANELILEKTTSFKGTPYINTIKIIITPDRQTDLYAFEKNIINSLNIDFSSWGNLNYKREKISTNIISNNFEYLGFNFDKQIFKNIDIRKAIAYIIPKDEIIKNIYLDNGVKSLAPINSTTFLAYKDIETYEYSVPKAIEALGKANITKDMANFSILVNVENKERVESAELIQKRLSQIGINVNIVKKPFEEYKKDLEQGNFDMFLAGIDFGIVPNLKSFLMSSGTGEGGINYQNFKDARMDFLVGNIYTATSEEAFIKATIDMQQYFAEQLPVVGIFFKDEILLTDYTVKGDKKPNIYNQFNNIEKWYIE